MTQRSPIQPSFTSPRERASNNHTNDRTDGCDDLCPAVRDVDLDRFHASLRLRDGVPEPLEASTSLLLGLRESARPPVSRSLANVPL